MESSTTDTGIYVELERTTKQVRLVLSRGTGLIERRTAMRQAESIARSGFLLSNGERIGRGWKLVIDEEDTSLPDRLTVSPRVSYSETAKSFGTAESSPGTEPASSEPEPTPEAEVEPEPEIGSDMEPDSEVLDEPELPED